jgi:hypothetical protein
LALQARTWLVRQDESGDFTAIQPCIDSAGDGDTVLVGPGAYMEFPRFRGRLMVWVFSPMAATNWGV